MDEVEIVRATEASTLDVILPRAFRRKHAAAYISSSETWLDSRRAADIERLKRGLEIEGPEWVKVRGLGIRYLREHLDAFLSRSEPRGSMEEKRHVGGER